MAFPTIVSLVPSISTRKGEGFYVELFFRYVPSPWSRSRKCKGIFSILEILEEIECVVAVSRKKSCVPDINGIGTSSYL